MEYSRVNNVEKVEPVGEMSENLLRDDKPEPLRNVKEVRTAQYEPVQRRWTSWLRPSQYRSDNAHRSWKPLSMAPLILASIAILSLLIAAAIETLAQRSRILGGLALSTTQDDIPYYAMVSYLYLPTVCAVLYSLIWSWVDLDVKRMQPWLELSKPSGAAAEDSLFLDYPYDFVAFVPLKAAKRKHWPVFLTGTTVMIVFWLITPLQTAILATGVIVRNEPVDISNRSHLAPLSNQSELLGMGVLNSGYAHAWLDQPLPPFTASDFATLPFYVEDDPAPTKQGTNWTASTTMLSTELECWPAEVSMNGPPSKASFDFLDGRGCNATIDIAIFLSSYYMFYVGYWGSPYSDYALAGPACPATSNSTHEFLAIWAETGIANSSSTPTFNITALFCQPHYYRQEAIVSVNADSYVPNNRSIQTTSKREPLSDTEFNTTAFEYMLANGVTEGTEARTVDFPFNFVVEQLPRLTQTNLSRPISNMVGYALGGQNLSTAEYSDPKILHEAYQRAHQYLFSFTVSQLFVNETASSNKTATSTFALSGIIVSRVFSAVVEALLILVAVFTVALLWLCHKAASHLPSNPSSLSRLLQIFRNGPAILDKFHSLGSADEKTLTNTFLNDTFRLSRTNGPGSGDVFIERVAGRYPEPAERELAVTKDHYDPIRPTVLRPAAGISFILAVLGAIIGVAYLKSQDNAKNGLRRPTNNFEVLQLLENYIPTIFATLIEPFWILVNRLLCVLQPFDALWRGKSTAQSSLDTTYTSLPPQLVVWRALKARNFLLVLVCTIALLANLLAVGLGALFNEKQVLVNGTDIFQPTLAAKLDGESVSTFGMYNSRRTLSTAFYRDHMYVAMANLTSGTTLPPWTSSEYFFQPYAATTSQNQSSGQNYVVSTRGFGVDPNCKPVAAAQVPADIPEYVANVNSTSCGDVVEIARSMMRHSTTTRSSGRSSIEYCNAFFLYEMGKLCPMPLTIGWGRTPLAQDVNATVEASFVVCKPVFQTAMFEVRVDALGYVLSYNKLGVLKSTLDYADSEPVIKDLLTYPSTLMSPLSNQWHNDTLTRDWMNYFLAISLGSRTFLDPAAPVPDPEKMIPAIENIYELLFAILLSVNHQLFQKGDPGAQITGTTLTNEIRIFMDEPAFIITMVVLVLNVIVACLVYLRVTAFVLPRMPTTIGSILAYVAPSRMVKEQASPYATLASRTYSFGKFIGEDRKVHLGIELDPLVVPIDPLSLRQPTASGAPGFMGRWRQKRVPTGAEARF